MFIDSWILGILQITAPSHTLKNASICSLTSPCQIHFCVERVTSSFNYNVKSQFKKKIDLGGHLFSRGRETRAILFQRIGVSIVTRFAQLYFRGESRLAPIHLCAVKSKEEKYTNFLSSAITKLSYSISRGTKSKVQQSLQFQLSANSGLPELLQGFTGECICFSTACKTWLCKIQCMPTA